MTDEANTNDGAQKRIRVVVADDSAAFRTAIGRLLERLPCVESIGFAEDGVQALALVAGTRPDLVLMDVQMPRLNGLEATRKIHADFPDIHVIMITLHDSEELKVASVVAGADWLISKRSLREVMSGAIAQLFPAAETQTENGI